MLIYVLQWRPSWISDRHKKQKLCREPSNDHSWAAGMKFKMAATAGLSLTLDPMGKMFQNASLGRLVSTVQVVSEKKRFETFSP
jgi:hypothetical protein